MTQAVRQDPHPRKKAFKPKVKTGCQTCKQRRVKCDENKPECRRCASTGRKCEGYRSARSEIGSDWQTHPWDLSWTPRVSSLEQTNDPTVASPSGVLCSQPCFFVFDTDEEQSCFEFFRFYSLPEFTALFPSDWEFWGSTVLSIAMLQPAIRHSISAIGALHRQYADGSNSLLPEDANHHKLVRYGLSQYTKALKAFADLAVSHAAIDRLFAAISCVLIIHISSLQGFSAACVRHLANALKLFDELETTARTSQQTSHDRHIKALRSILLSLQSQARSQNFDDIPLQYISFTSPSGSHHTNEDGIIRFASLTEARDYYTILANELQYLAPDFDAAVASVGPLQDNCLPLFTRLLAAEDGLRQLQLSQQQHHIDTSNSPLSFLTLQLDYCSLDLYLRAFPLLGVHGEMAWDIFDAHFDKIIDLSHQILVVSTPRTPAAAAAPPSSASSIPPTSHPTSHTTTTTNKPTFHIAQGALGPLFTTAVHCRVPRIRHAALDLLRAYPRREGLWDNTSAARVAEAVVGLEERLWRQRWRTGKNDGGGGSGGGGGNVGSGGDNRRRAGWGGAEEMGEEWRRLGEAVIERDCRVVDVEVVYLNPRVANVRLRTEEGGWGEWERKAMGVVEGAG